MWQLISDRQRKDQMTVLCLAAKSKLEYDGHIVQPERVAQ